MTIKTFQSITNPDTTCRVRGFGDSGVELFHRNGGITLGSLIAPSDAPALALAILEAAGYKEEQGNETTEAAHHFGMSMLHLRYGIKEQEYITAEAEAQAKLEAEALELCDSARHAHGRFKIGNFGLMKDAEKTTWLAVARRAREINKEEK